MRTSEGEVPVFLQIPKTGTTTLTAIMRANYEPGTILEAKILEEGPHTLESDIEESCRIRGRLARQAEEISAVSAMVPFGIHRYLRRKCRYFTLVREPIDRCVSLWFFMARRGKPEVVASGYDLGVMISRELHMSFFDEMTRMLSGSSSVRIGERDFEQAKENIRHAGVLVEDIGRFDGFVRRLSRRFGWRRTSYEKLNVAGDKPLDSLPADYEALLRGANTWDLRLYAWLGDEGFIRSCRD